MQKTGVSLFILSTLIASVKTTHAMGTKHPPDELTATTDVPQVAALPAATQADNQLSPAASTSAKLTAADRQGDSSSLKPEQVDDDGQRTEADLPTPLTLPYDEDSSIPEGYRIERRSRRGLVIAGSFVYARFVACRICDCPRTIHLFLCFGHAVFDDGAGLWRKVSSFVSTAQALISLVVLRKRRAISFPVCPSRDYQPSSGSR